MLNVQSISLTADSAAPGQPLKGRITFIGAAGVNGTGNSLDVQLTQQQMQGIAQICITAAQEHSNRIAQEISSQTANLVRMIGTGQSH